MEELILYAGREAAGERLDKFISENAEGISRSYAAKLSEEGMVFANGKQAGKNHKIKEGDDKK